jgi:hypothetical protein
LRPIAFIALGLVTGFVSACSSSGAVSLEAPGDGQSDGASPGRVKGWATLGGDDGGGACNYVTTRVALNDVTAAGVSPARFAAMVKGTHLATLTWGPTPSSEFSVSPTGTTALTVTVTTMDSRWTITDAGGGLCAPGTIEVPATVSFVTADGGFNETWAVSLAAALTDESMYFSEPLDLTSGVAGSFAGSLRIMDNDAEMWTSAGATAFVTFSDAGVSGNVTYETSFMGSTTTGGAGGSIAAGGGAIYTAARWVPLASDAGIDAASGDDGAIDATTDAP